MTLKMSEMKEETGTLEKFFNAIFLGNDVMTNAFTVIGEIPEFPNGLFGNKACIKKSCT